MLLILDILYSALNLKAVIVIGSRRVIYFININIKICLIKKEKALELNLSYIFN